MSLPTHPFLFPRVISLRRSVADDSVGMQDYSGVTEAQEATVASAIAARIQADRTGSAPGTKLPADAAGQSIWKVIFKAPLGLVRDRDVIVDDQGLRYHVISSYWGPLVTTCRCEILEN